VQVGCDIDTTLIPPGVQYGAAKDNIEMLGVSTKVDFLLARRDAIFKAFPTYSG
jgi:hypothetical protein